MKTRLLSIVCFGYLWSSPLFAQEHHHDSMKELGSVNFPVSCTPAVQEKFTRGMALLYSFEYEQAQQAFETVSQTDPACAMAYWGQGMSLYHQLWSRPSRATLQQGAKLLG